MDPEPRVHAATPAGGRPGRRGTRAGVWVMTMAGEPAHDSPGASPVPSRDVRGRPDREEELRLPGHHGHAVRSERLLLQQRHPRGPLVLPSLPRGQKRSRRRVRVLDVFPARVAPRLGMALPPTVTVTSQTWRGPSASVPQLTATWIDRSDVHARQWATHGEIDACSSDCSSLHKYKRFSVLSKRSAPFPPLVFCHGAYINSHSLRGHRRWQMREGSGNGAAGVDPVALGSRGRMHQAIPLQSL